MTQCKKCGKCCECITINKYIIDSLKESIRIDCEYPGDFVLSEDQVFLLKNLKEISVDDAKKINPYLVKCMNHQNYIIHSYFFTCTLFDKKSRLCKGYNNRPYMCSDFPWYSRTPYFYHLYSSTCAFHKDYEKNFININNERIQA